jgi:Na+/phosphate symporter
MLPYFTQLVQYVSRGMSVQQTIANAHMIFNGLGVLIMLPFVGVYEKLLDRLVRQAPENIAYS